MLKKNEDIGLSQRKSLFNENILSNMPRIREWSRQFSSVAQSCPTLCDPMNRSMPGLPVHHQFPELAQTHVHWVGDSIQPSHPLSSPSNLPSIRLFCNKSVLCIRWPKYWSFSLSISPSNEYSELISFRMDWFDLLTLQGTLKSLLQHHSSKASILPQSAFFWGISVGYTLFVS